MICIDVKILCIILTAFCLKHPALSVGAPIGDGQVSTTILPQIQQQEGPGPVPSPFLETALPLKNASVSVSEMDEVSGTTEVVRDADLETTEQDIIPQEMPAQDLSSTTIASPTSIPTGYRDPKSTTRYETVLDRVEDKFPLGGILAGLSLVVFMLFTSYGHRLIPFARWILTKTKREQGAIYFDAPRRR